uniref:Uncharacterized protein n=1 Tax=Escherichia coli TaxID=562 RepID=A0A7U1HSP6_ECOLX|nr:hypothetical protein [Escherichia coli]
MLNVSFRSTERQTPIIFVLALYSVSPLLLTPALSGDERIKVLAEQTGGAVFSALVEGRYSTSNNVREPL